jgi:hypothetical protein
VKTSQLNFGRVVITLLLILAPQEGSNHTKLKYPSLCLTALFISNLPILVDADNELASKLKMVDNDEVESYGVLIMYLDDYLNKKRGRIDCILERILNTYPISAKHNPYYGSAFDGTNDCMCILAIVASFFHQVWFAINNEEFTEEEKR